MLDHLTSRFWKAALLGVAVGALGSVLAGSLWGLALEENNTLTWLFKLRGFIQPPPEAVVVGIDRRVAQELELNRNVTQWPRSTHAQLIDKLVSRGVAVIVMDIAFIESRTSEEDAELTAAVARAQRVVLLEYTRRETAQAGGIIMDRLNSPIPPLLDAAVGVAPFVLPKEPVRLYQFWAFRDIAGETPTIPGVALQVYALRLLDPFLELLREHGFPDPDSLPRNRSEVRNAQDLRELMRKLRLGFRENLQLQERLLGTLSSENDAGWSLNERRLLTALVKLYGGEDTYYFNFYGGPATFPFLPYDAVLNPGNSDNPGDSIDLEGKVVFVGMAEYSSAEQRDAFYSVYRRSDGVDLAGVEIAATAFSNLLTDQTLQRRLAFNHGSLLLFGSLVGMLAYLLPGVRAFAATLVIGAIYFGLALLLFVNHQLWIPVFIPLLFQLPSALFLGLFFQYLGAQRERESFRQWVPKKALPEVHTGTAFGTCLLTDIQGSRSLSSRLHRVEYNSLMERYYDRVVLPVTQHNGRIWDFSGDGMMCLFTAEEPQKALRQNACRAALEILVQVDLFNQQMGEDQQVPTRIGLHTDWIELGGKTLGDAGNTVSSIEGLNKLLSTQILASGAAAGDLDGFLRRPVGSFLLPGKSEPLAIVELMDLRESAGESQLKLCERFAEVLEAFEAGHWSKTGQLCQEILVDYPKDGPARFYLDQTRRYRDEGPPSDPMVIRIGSRENR